MPLINSLLVQAHDAPEGRALLDGLKQLPLGCHLITTCAYEGDATRQLALNLGFVSVVLPKSTRVEPWKYKKALYRRRNEIERLLRRLRGFRRIFSRLEKLDLVFIAFIYFARIVEGRR